MIDLNEMRDNLVRETIEVMKARGYSVTEEEVENIINIVEEEMAVKGRDRSDAIESIIEDVKGED